MGDIGGGLGHLVEAGHEAKLLTLKIDIQARKSRIVRLNQDIEDLKEAAIKAKEVEVMRLEDDLKELNKRLDIITPTDATIIEVKP